MTYFRQAGCSPWMRTGAADAQACVTLSWVLVSNPWMLSWLVSFYITHALQTLQMQVLRGQRWTDCAAISTPLSYSPQDSSDLPEAAPNHYVKELKPGRQRMLLRSSQTRTHLALQVPLSISIHLLLSNKRTHLQLSQVQLENPFHRFPGKLLQAALMG